MNKLNQRIAALLMGCGVVASANAAAPTAPQGFITAKSFNNITGTAIANLTNNAKFPNNPDVVTFPSYFEWNATGDIATAPGNYADNYGGQMAGYFYPPTTGDYVFYIAADDNARLFLSPDSDPAKKRLIAQETAYSGVRSYTSSAGNSDLNAKDSSLFAATEWATKDPATGGAKITLQAGQPYYIEALFKEGTGGDLLSVAVMDPTGTIDSSAPIPGQYLSSDRSTGALTITTQPQGQTAGERGSATFRVVADGTPPYSYQWRKGGVDIADATNLTYTVTGVQMADNNAKFSVVVTGPQGAVTSSDATLTVTPDTTVPTLVGAKGSANRTELVLTFSEPVDPTTGGLVANYQISTASGTVGVTAAAVSASGTQVTLTTAQQTLGTKHTVTVSGVKDTAATPNTIATNSRMVFFPAGKVVEMNGMIVFEAENYDRNLDGLWRRDTTRGVPSGGAYVIIPNGVGGSESETKLEYDIEFAQAGTYTVWYRASADVGEDDSAWLHLDGARPAERAEGNMASMTGFQPNADFVWRSDAQDPPDPFTIEIATPGLHVIGLARREDGAAFDKFILTTDAAYSPTGLGPSETRQGAPGLPTVTLTGPTSGATFNAGSTINLSATAAGQSGLNITRVEFSANGAVIGTSSNAPYTFSWTNATAGVYGVRATGYDELGQATASDSATVTVQAGVAKPTVAWVSFHRTDSPASQNATTAGFTNAPDKAYTDLLKANGYEVTRIVTTGTPDTNVLNAYDLVIISRSVPSGDYETAAEAAAWNGVRAPMMILGGYIIRANRLGLMTGSTIPDTTGSIKLAVNNPAHPIFSGIQLGAGNVMVNDYANLTVFGTTTNRGISVVTGDVAGNGTVLATVGTETDPTFGGMIIAEYDAGATMGNPSASVLGGDRLVFLTGSREYNGLTSEGAGIIDLTADGVKMFLNAVAHMAGVQNPGPAPTISIVRNANGSITITFTGTLQSSTNLTTWTDEQGSGSITVAADAPRKFYRAKR